MVPSVSSWMTWPLIQFHFAWSSRFLSISFEGHDNQATTNRTVMMGSWTINPLSLIVRIEKRNLKHPDEEAKTFYGMREDDDHLRFHFMTNSISSSRLTSWPVKSVSIGGWVYDSWLWVILLPSLVWVHQRNHFHYLVKKATKIEGMLLIKRIQLFSCCDGQNQCISANYHNLRVSDKIKTT